MKTAYQPIEIPTRLIAALGVGLALVMELFFMMDSVALPYRSISGFFFFMFFLIGICAVIFLWFTFCQKNIPAYYSIYRRIPIHEQAPGHKKEKIPSEGFHALWYKHQTSWQELANTLGFFGAIAICSYGEYYLVHRFGVQGLWTFAQEVFLGAPPEGIVIFSTLFVVFAIFCIFHLCFLPTHFIKETTTWKKVWVYVKRPKGFIL